ncbi:unnamed protein product [Sphenostylis stenocarpa]|uniref:Uncharacterized protein n=1 Tax=Sphenostylis stenocarpa TaxID=92480 RepID=A0AA86SG52_9FABA|nr:unnamed protein product [Sphenostylis stenocarpa]
MCTLIYRIFGQLRTACPRICVDSGPPAWNLRDDSLDSWPPTRLGHLARRRRSHFLPQPRRARPGLTMQALGFGQRSLVTTASFFV